MSESNKIIDRLKERYIFSRLTDKKKLIVSYYISGGFLLLSYHLTISLD